MPFKYFISGTIYLAGNSLKTMEEIVETVVKLGLLNDEQPSLVRCIG
jgi:hypothetical protein